MAWTVKIEKAAKCDLAKLDAQIARRILKFLHARLTCRDDPRSTGEALKGTELGEFWKYRVGDYRIICRLVDATVTVFVVRIGHRSKVYRQ
jgi:mRNA interferase RelE/StbE